MIVYQVGGCVRDILLSRNVNDYDYVVVDTDEVELKLMGFTQVGKDFPVFLHPDTNDEWALARRERKSGVGYNGFTFDIDNVTIEEDLARRDLTINAMAIPVTDKTTIIDPFDGQSDIKNKVLRAVSLETFIEDPVRVLRLARFAATLGDEWTIDPQTLQAAALVVGSDDWPALTRERVWKETEKALRTDNPDRFFRVLEQLGERVWFPEVMACRQCPQPPNHHPEGDVFEHTMQGLAVAANKGYPLDVRFAVLCHDLGKPITYEAYGKLHGHEEAGTDPVNVLCERLSVSSYTRRVALLTTLKHLNFHRIAELRPNTVVKMFSEMRAYQSPSLLTDVLQACECDALARNNPDDDYPQAALAWAYFNTSNFNVTKEILRKFDAGTDGVKIGAALHQERVAAVARYKRKITDEQHS